MVWSVQTDGQTALDSDNSGRSALCCGQGCCNRIFPRAWYVNFFFCLFALKTREKVCSGSGNLFGWGCNELGQVGPNLPEFIPSPVETDSSKRVQAIAAGDCSSVSMLSGSQVFFWGSNWIKGKPGVAVKPTRVMFPRAITQISLGERHLLALADNRTVFAIGFADKGQIGTGKVRVVVVFFASVSHSGFSFKTAMTRLRLYFRKPARWILSCLIKSKQLLRMRSSRSLVGTIFSNEERKRPAQKLSVFVVVQVFLLPYQRRDK